MWVFSAVFPPLWTVNSISLGCGQNKTHEDVTSGVWETDKYHCLPLATCRKDAWHWQNNQRRYREVAAVSRKKTQSGQRRKSVLASKHKPRRCTNVSARLYGGRIRSQPRSSPRQRLVHKRTVRKCCIASLSLTSVAAAAKLPFQRRGRKKPQAARAIFWFRHFIQEEKFDIGMFFLQQHRDLAMQRSSWFCPVQPVRRLPLGHQGLSVSLKGHVTRTFPSRGRGLWTGDLPPDNLPLRPPGERCPGYYWYIATHVCATGWMCQSPAGRQRRARDWVMTQKINHLYATECSRRRVCSGQTWFESPRRRVGKRKGKMWCNEMTMQLCVCVCVCVCVAVCGRPDTVTIFGSDTRK